jgi:hypothetical protein
MNLEHWNPDEPSQDTRGTSRLLSAKSLAQPEQEGV